MVEQTCGDRVDIRYLSGGLAPDSDEPMPADMRAYLQQTWATIQQQIPGTRFNFDFWHNCQPRRSTWPSCRAVIAARKQGDDKHAKMTQAIQQAYYLQARNPSDDDTLVAIAESLGLNVPQFTADLHSAETRQAHQQDMQLIQQLGIRGFPGLVLVAGQSSFDIGVDYNNYKTMLTQIEQFIETALQAYRLK